MLATGCFLTTSFDDLSSGGPGVVTPPDEEVDGSTPRDAARDAKAGPDSAGGVDGGDTRPFCVREKDKGHLFCSDYETGTPLDGVWNGTSTEASGTATVDATTKVFATTTTALATGATGKGILVFKVSRTVTKTTLAFDMNVVSCPLTVDGTTKGQATLVSVGQGDDPKWIVGILLSSDGFLANHTRCTGTCSGTSIPLAGGLSFGKWSRITQTVDVKASKMSVTVDGAAVLTDTPVTLLSGTSATLIVNVGLANRGPASACRAEYDNVTFDVE